MYKKTTEIESQYTWTSRQKRWFRVAFIFITLFSIPLDWGFYQMIAHFDYANLNYRHLTEIVAFFNPQFIDIFSESGFFGIASYVNIPFILILSIIGGWIWGRLDKETRAYPKLYYWVTVFARYRVAYAGIGWGYKKLFIMQMPRQYEGLWNTELIDFFAKRLYWEVLSVVPTYEFFLGFTEFLAGFLLLFRKTTTIGAALALVVFGNIAISNHAYDIGEQVPSAVMAMLSLFILWKDIPVIYYLIVLEKDSKITHFYPIFKKPWQKYGRLAVKIVFNGIFVVLFFIFEVYAFMNNDFYKIPNTPGLKGTTGYYHVTEFRINDTLLPYNPMDTVRWQNVTFEDWSSISIKYADRPQPIEMFAAKSYPRRHEVYDGKWYFHIQGDIRRYGDVKHKEKHDPSKRDLNISWEFSGMGGRHWFHYSTDTAKQILYLTHKNKALREQTMILHYQQSTDDRMILKGINEKSDSIYVVLDRSDYRYPLLTHDRKNETR